MSLTGFTKQDFELMELPGLDTRMAAIKQRIQPKFKDLAEYLTPFLSEQVGMPFYTHIARHARRTVNPPDSTWFAIAQDKRGYKKYPHFQFGIWPTHLFFWLAIIEEYPDKKQFGEALLTRVPEILQNTPDHFSWSLDHMKDEYVAHHTLDEKQLQNMFSRLKNVRKAELMCGVVISKDDPIAGQGDKLAIFLKEQSTKLLPLYKLANQCTGVSIS